MEKEFIPYEQALALKELGFDEPCFGFFTSLKQLRRYTNFDGELNEFQSLKNSNITMGNEWCTAPTFSQAFRFFREKYNIDAWVQPFVAQSEKNLTYLPDESYCYFIFKDGVFVCDKVDLLDTEEAELECLKKLIEIVKEKK